MTVLVDRLLDAFGRYDADALAPLLAPQMRHWINVTEQEQDAAATIAQLQLEARHVTDTRFNVRHHVETDEGFVLQLVVEGSTTGGETFRVPACLVVAVREGLITRIDEYVDIAAARPIIAEMCSG